MYFFHGHGQLHVHVYNGCAQHVTCNFQQCAMSILSMICTLYMYTVDGIIVGGLAIRHIPRTCTHMYTCTWKYMCIAQ